MGILRREEFGITTLYAEKGSNDQKVKAIGSTTTSIKATANHFYGDIKSSYWIDKITARQFYVYREYTKQRKIDAPFFLSLRRKIKRLNNEMLLIIRPCEITISKRLYISHSRE